MPLSALLALAILNWPGADRPGPLAEPELRARLAEALAVAGLVTALAALFGRAIARAVARRGGNRPAIRRALALGTRGFESLVVVAFGLTVAGLEWPRVVRGLLGDADRVVVDDVLLLAPYLLTRLGVWWGLHAGVCALRPDLAGSPGRYLIRNARQAFGLILPVVLAFILVQDLLHRACPGLEAVPAINLGVTVAFGLLVMAFSPALVRLNWPTRPLPPGPLRDRLEGLAGRCGFRYTDLLVWDTEMGMINAMVTGPTPLYRYVLLSDALVAYVDPREVEAILGHEIGHIAHRHPRDMALFFLGSLGVIALVRTAIQPLPVDAAIRYGLSLAFLGGYIRVVFGALSRRFERQSDLFAARSVSCDRPGCPPHGAPGAGPTLDAASPGPCPVGIRTFANALVSIAARNGASPAARSWRHGSIGSRVAFLEGLEGRPDSARRFQAGVDRFRLALALLLGASLLLAWRAGALDPSSFDPTGTGSRADPAPRAARPAT